MRAHNARVPDPAEPAPLPWYHRPLWVLLLLFVVLGPFGLPYLWKSPAFSRPAKIALTAAVALYTALLVQEGLEAYRAIERELGAFQALPEL